MKNYLSLFTIAALLFSCGENKPTETVKKEKNNPDSIWINDSLKTAQMIMPPKPEVFIPNGKTGKEGFIKQLFCGEFKATRYDLMKEPAYYNRITICIDSINGENISGFSVVAGNRRPFSGKMKETTATEFYCEVREPGDDKYDGSFRFSIFTAEKKMKGHWFANNKKLAVTERSFDLPVTAFKYDPSLELPEAIASVELYNKKFENEEMDFERVSEQVSKINASTTELKVADVENLYKGDLEIIRNSIYARHGYSFKSRRMRYVFDQVVTWYVPLYTDVRAMLSPLEIKNIELLKRYEEHAENYYDSYGR